MRFLKTLTTIIFILSFFILFGQSNTRVNSLALDSLEIRDLKQLYKKNVKPKGYKIQLLVSEKKDTILKLRNKFVKEIKGIKTYRLYEQPYFKLRVGQYHTKIEAEGAIRKIREKFPSSYLVKDKLDSKDLVESVISE